MMEAPKFNPEMEFEEYIDEAPVFNPDADYYEYSEDDNTTSTEEEYVTDGIDLRENAKKNAEISKGRLNKLIEENPDMKDAYTKALNNIDISLENELIKIDKQELEKQRIKKQLEEFKPSMGAGERTQKALPSIVGGAKRPVLGIMRLIEGATDKFDITDPNTEKVKDWIIENEKDIEKSLLDAGLNPDSMTPADISQFMIESAPLGVASWASKFFTRFTPAMMTESVSAFFGSFGTAEKNKKGEYEPTTPISAGMSGLVTGVSVGTGAVVTKALAKQIAAMRKQGLITNADEILDFIKKNDENFNDDKAIDDALEEYYKIYEPSGNIKEDKIRALLGASETMGQELKAGAGMLDNEVIPALRKQAKELKENVEGIVKTSDSVFDDVSNAIDKAVSSPQYKNGLKIIKENFNTDIPIDKAQWKKFSNELKKIAELESDNFIYKNLHRQIDRQLKRAEKLGVEPTVDVVKMIDWEKSLGEVAYKLKGSTTGFKVGEADTMVTDLVEKALKEQPEGLKLYKQMKEIYSEASPFTKKAKPEQANKIGQKIRDISDKNITIQTGLKEINTLREKGSAKLEELTKVVGAKNIENFENKIVDYAVSKSKDFDEMIKFLDTTDVTTANAKQAKEYIKQVDKVLSSTNIEKRVQNLIKNVSGDATAITADLMQKVKYSLMSRLWNRMMTIVRPSMAEAKEVGDLLSGVGTLLKNPNKVKAISKVSDKELRETISKTIKKRKKVVSKAKDATQYESSRQATREANKKKLREIGEQKRAERKKKKELEAKKKAGRLGF